MTALRERWMFFGTFILSILFICFFIVPNYKGADSALHESAHLEHRIQQLELRQAEVESMRVDYEDLQNQVDKKCKFVPKNPDMSQIVQSLSLDVDGRQVLDQSFTAGLATSMNTPEGFSSQPLAIMLHADFDSIFSVIQNIESMDRLVQISSIRVVRSERDSDISEPPLEAAIGLHAMYDSLEIE